MTKPAYHVPTMVEVNATKPNGLTVLSTFSGCGGSCIGFKLAGFTTLWASEFIPAARRCYELNFPGVPLDDRDIRKVEPLEILKLLGKSQGEVDVVEGSPPCASFSTAGIRQHGWDEVRKYSDTKQRVDDLFWEFARIIRGIQPKVFVAENVKGLTMGKAKGYFLEIKKELAECGYRVGAKVLDAQWLGVPQHRERLIFIGVREDLDVEPPYPKPLPYQYGIVDAMPGVQSFTIRDRFYEDVRIVATKVSPTVDTHGVSAKDYSKLEVMRWAETEPRRLTIDELKALCSFPPDFELVGSYAQQWERCGRAVPPLVMKAIASTIAKEVFGRDV